MDRHTPAPAPVLGSKHDEQQEISNCLWQHQPKQLAAQEVAKGKNQLEAIETAGYAPHDSNASRVIGNDKVKSRIRELQEQAAMSISITLEGQIAKLEDLLNQAKALNQISAAVSAIDKQNELMGFKIQRVESKRVNEFENMSDEELRQYIYGNIGLDRED